MEKYKKILITGKFNVIHPGHLRLFKYAKEIGHHLTVAIESDELGKENTFLSENYRLEGLQSNNYIDDCFVYRSSVEQVIKDVRPNIILKGKEHESKYNIEEKIVEEIGAKIIFSSGEVVFSSLEIIKNEINRKKKYDFLIPREYLKRHSIKKGDLIDVIEGFKKVKVCVIGDLIIDEYIDCQPVGMSQEDPTIVVSPVDSKKYIGGAAIVASHAKSLGSTVNFISIIGNDDIGKYAKSELKKHGLNNELLIDITRPTTHKIRYRSRSKTLLRVNNLYQEKISVILQNQIVEKFKFIVKDLDLLIFSDFNYGCLPNELVEKLITICEENSLKYVADSQSSSQIGDISRFKNAVLITPTEYEARISIRNFNDGLAFISDELLSRTNSKYVFLKLGEEGFLIHTKEKNITVTDQVPALNQSPKDVSGAGDSLLVAASLSLIVSNSIWLSAFIGSLAAAIQVSRIGNTPIELNEILQVCYDSF